MRNCKNIHLDIKPGATVAFVFGTRSGKNTKVNFHIIKNFKEKYSDDEFIYEAKAKKLNAWDRFKESLFDLFERIFN